MPLLTRFKSLFHKGASPAEDGQSRPKAAPGSPEGVGGTVLSPRSPELTALQMAEQQDWEVKDLKGWKKGDVILDTYRVEDIKAGGMGVVYIAEHQGWRVNMAIKSPNQRMLSNRSFYARVLRESEEWIRLGLHPHIAYCYYVRKIEEVPHIFIEYVNGGNLREWIAEARCYDLKVGLDLAIQFCHGMVGLADGLNNRAVSFLELGREEEAMPLLDQALEVEPMHLEATYNRGLLDWRRGRINDTEVVVRMTEVCAGHPERWKGGYLLGLIHLERSDAESAVKVLEEVANATPDVTQVRDALDRARSGIGQWERCVRTLEGHTYGVTSVAFRPDGRYALSGSDDKTLRLWYLDWDYEFPDPVDWDKGARLYLKTFLTLHTPVRPDGFSRTGKPTWNEDDFQQLIQKLQYAGYGWLRPEGVRKELESMASGWQGPPGL